MNMDKVKIEKETIRITLEEENPLRAINDMMNSFWNYFDSLPEELKVESDEIIVPYRDSLEFFLRLENHEWYFFPVIKKSRNEKLFCYKGANYRYRGETIDKDIEWKKIGNDLVEKYLIRYYFGSSITPENMKELIFDFFRSFDRVLIGAVGKKEEGDWEYLFYPFPLLLFENGKCYKVMTDRVLMSNVDIFSLLARDYLDIKIGLAVDE